MTKPWWASKTIWMALFEIAGGVVGSACAGEYVGATGYIVAIAGAVQAVLRLVTKQPLGTKG